MRATLKHVSRPPAPNGFRLPSVLVIALLFAACDKPAPTTANSTSGAAGASVIGKRIEFKQGGDSEQYRLSGWSKSEEKFTWNEGNSAKLSLPIEKMPGALVLKITMAALIHEPDLPTQPVEVYVSGQKIADWQVGNTAEFTATIPGEMTKDGSALAIELKTPKATSPKALGQSADPRVLGVCVHAVELAKTS